MPGWDERLRGWLDVPLDGVGLEEAAKTAEEIGGLGSVDAIYCSDLRRARQTAEAFRRRTKAPVVATRDLRPWNPGGVLRAESAGHSAFSKLRNSPWPELAAPAFFVRPAFYPLHAPPLPQSR